MRRSTLLHSTRRLLVALAAAFTLAAGAPEAAAVIIDGVAARVNAKIITMYDVRMAATPYLLQRGLSPDALADPARRGGIYRRVVDDLIERELLLQEARKLDLTVSDDEIEQWLAFTRQQQNLSEGQFRQTIEKYGMEYDDYREMVRQNLIKMRITRIKVGAKISVSDAEVEAAYRDRYGDLSLNETYITVSHVLIQPKSERPEDVARARQRAEDVRQRILDGEDFGEVAARESDGPSSKNRGKLGTFRRGELDREFERAAFALDRGEISGVVKTKFGFHIILVTAIDERSNPDVEDRKDEIRGELRQRATERQLDSYVKGLRSRAFIDVKL